MLPTEYVYISERPRCICPVQLHPNLPRDVVDQLLHRRENHTHPEIHVFHNNLVLSSTLSKSIAYQVQ